MKKNLQNLIGDYITQLEEKNELLIERFKLVKKRITDFSQLYEGKDNLITYECNELLKILDDIELDEEIEDKEYETYTLTEDEENGTKLINGEWYRVEKK